MIAKRFGDQEPFSLILVSRTKSKSEGLPEEPPTPSQKKLLPLSYFLPVMIS